MDNALVAITADYPGFFPASQVTTTEVLTPSFDPRSILTILYQWCIAGGAFKAGSRTRGGRPTRVSPAQQAEEECDANRNVAATVWSTAIFKGRIPRRYINAHNFSRRKSARRTESGEVANQASASHAPSRGPEVEANTRQEPVRMFYISDESGF